MSEELIKKIEDIVQNVCTNKKDLPNVLYAKEIAERYAINLNKATEFCRKYGINFGGWCIENTKFKEILHNSNGYLL